MAAAAARYATWVRNRSGIVIPARRISRAESDARVPGFISHAERDPRGALTLAGRSRGTSSSPRFASLTSW